MKKFLFFLSLIGYAGLIDAMNGPKSERDTSLFTQGNYAQSKDGIFYSCSYRATPFFVYLKHQIGENTSSKLTTGFFKQKERNEYFERFLECVKLAKELK